MSRQHTDAAMKEYLSALLTEEAEAPDAGLAELTKAPVARLLAQIKPPAPAADKVIEEPVVGRIPPRSEVQPAAAPAPPPAAAPSEPAAAPAAAPAQEQLRETVQQQLDTQAGSDGPTDAMQEYQSDDFQALFFSVAGLTLAVPLKSLGGIHQLQKPSPLFGKPAWFLGIMTERDDKLQVVDTARWVMPEKYDALADKIEYQYLIMLKDSRWGLACEALVTSTTISPDAVQWRRTEQGGKRPWLAGVVREKMCALLNVDALVAMLDKGLGSQQG